MQLHRHVPMPLITASSTNRVATRVNTKGMSPKAFVPLPASDAPITDYSALEQAVIADAKLLGLFDDEQPQSTAKKLLKGALVVLACAGVVVLLQIATAVLPISIKH